MYLVTIRLLGARRALPRACSDLRAGFLASFQNEESPRAATLHHVYVQPSGVGADAVLFLTADTIEAAEAAAGSAVRRCLTAQVDAAYSVLYCAVDLLSPIAEALLRQYP